MPEPNGVSSTSWQGRTRVAALDGLRGVAAVTVLIGHTFFAVSMPDGLRTALLRSPLVLFVNGEGAVFLFFVLSGFCLASSAASSRTCGEVTQFYVRRVFRIHPPYMVALLFAWFASFLYGSSSLWSGLTEWIVRRSQVHLGADQLVQSLLWPGQAFGQLPVGWTLRVEILFSLLLPLMMLVARQSHWLVLVAGSALLLWDPVNPIADFRYGLCFSLGIAVFEVRDALGRFFATLSQIRAALLVLAATAIFALPQALKWPSEALQVIFSGSGGAVLMMGALFVPFMSRIFSAPAVAYLGKISYSIYLFHFTVLILCTRVVRHPVTVAEWLGLLLLVFGLTTILAALSYRYVERPSINLGNGICRALVRRREAAVRASELSLS